MSVDIYRRQRAAAASVYAAIRGMRIDTYLCCLYVYNAYYGRVNLFVEIRISQVIGCEDRLRNDLYCVEWGVKLYSNQPTNVEIRNFSISSTRIWRACWG